MATLRTELRAHGNGVGQHGSSLSGAVPNAISVFFNPAASDVVMEAAIKDILDKLELCGLLSPRKRPDPPSWRRLVGR